MAKRKNYDDEFGYIAKAEVETKRVMGVAMGTRMDWLCTVAKGGFGFGGEKSLTCVDMTVHAIEHDKPNVVVSTYMKEKIRRRHFNRDAYSSPEQVAMAEKIRKNWGRIRNNQLLKFSKSELEEQMGQGKY